MNATTFAHITDLHLSHPDAAGARRTAATVETLDTVIALLNALEPEPAFVVASGDLTNRGEEESYRFLKQRMSALKAPVVYALGNHDRRAGFYRGMLGREHDLQAPYDHDQLIKGIHVVALDSSVPGRVGGALAPEQFDFLEAALRRHPDLPKVLVIHHPPALDRELRLGWESITVDNSERLADMLAGGRVAGILSGYIHFDRVAHWHGIPVIVGGGLHTSVDILYRKGLRIVEGASFGLCTLRSSGLSVSFAPLPSERREISVHRLDRLRTLARGDAPSAK